MKVFDPSLTMKQQLQRALIGSVFLILAVFLIVLLGSGLGTISESRNRIISRLNEQTRIEVGKVSGAIADVVSQRLNTVAASVVQTMHSQALAFMRDTPTPLKSVSSWPEFEFKENCTVAMKCPGDSAFRALANNTFSAFVSLNSSSVYTMINYSPGNVPVLGAPFSTPSEFDRFNSSVQYRIPAFVNSKLALLDRVFSQVYSKGPSKDAMFFLYSAASMADPDNDNQRLSMLRQYPGMKRQVEDPSQVYDPAQRSWFTSAPTSGVGLRVYQETFTSQLVINLATKTSFYPSVTSDPVLPCPPIEMANYGATTEFAPYAASSSVCSSYYESYRQVDQAAANPSCCRSPCGLGPDFSDSVYSLDVPAAEGTMRSSQPNTYVGTRPYRCAARESGLRHLNGGSESKEKVTVVHAAVLALDEVAAILSRIEMQANRFVVICNDKTQEVIIFNGTAGRYDPSQAMFYKLDSYFPDNGDTSLWFKEESFTATFQGSEYFAAVTKTFNKQLTVFAFGRSSDIFSSYSIFDLRAKETSGKIAAIVLAGIVASVILSAVFIAITVTSINHVLAILTKVSAQIVKISTEAVRDYSECIRSCNLDGVRWYVNPPMEFRSLLFNFRDVIKRLAFFETAKKARETKSQKNPLYKLARLFLNTNEPAPAKLGSLFKLNPNVVGQKGIKVRKSNSLESEVIGYIDDFGVTYQIAAATLPLAKLNPASCIHVRSLQPVSTLPDSGGSSDASQVKVEDLSGKALPASFNPLAAPVIDDPQLFGWISMTLDGDAAFIDADANETASRHPEVVSKGEPEKLLKTPESCVPRELVVEYVQANLSLNGQSQTQIVANSVSAVASVDNVVINILEESDSETVTSADPWRLSTRLHFLITFPVFLCLAAISVSMLAVLSTDSVNWFPETKNVMVQFTQSNILTTAYLRSLFVQAFYDQIAMSMSVTSQLDADVLSGVTLKSDWVDSVIARNPMWAQNVLIPRSPPSGANQFAYPFGPTTVTGGYYWSGRVDHAVVRNLTINRQASVLDYYHKGALNPSSRLMWIQFGFSDIALSRRYPYNFASYDNPRDANNDPVCLAELFPKGGKVSSFCPICPALQNVMPSYDARCRTWFGYGRDRATTEKSFFMAPRIGAVTGSDVITGVIQVAHSPQNVILNFNFAPTVLVDAINKEKILSLGYFFIVDCENILTDEPVFTVHPGSQNCQDVQDGVNPVQNSLKCAEANMCCGKVQGGHTYEGKDFSSAEWTIFKASLGAGCALRQSSFPYDKGGEQHYASMSTLALPLQKFAVVAVVPYAAIVDGPESIARTITATVLGITIGLSVFAGLSLLFGIYKMRHLVAKISEPVLHLSDLCISLKADDLSVEVKEEASSVDMRNVLSAFSRMIISLRFGSDTYVMGNLAKAQEVFMDALDLFKSIQNSRGVAIAHNNLGSVFLKSGNFAVAQQHLNSAVEQSRLDLQASLATAAATPDPIGNMHPDVKRAHKTLGDRLGNLALCLQKMGKHDEHKILLQECLRHNEEASNTVGFIIQQVNLADTYLADGNITSAVACVGRMQSQIKEVDVFGQLPLVKQHACLQRLLLCQALVAYHLNQNLEALKLVVECLTAHEFCDLSVSRRGIQLLGELYPRLQRADLLDSIVNPVQVAVFPEMPAAVIKAAAPKDVLFVLDYSGSMAGTRIKASTQNILMVFNEYIKDDDRVMLNHFNTKVYTDVPLGKKRDIAVKFVEAVNNLASPNGGTAFYDAVYGAAQTLKQSSAKSYIIGLTDGEDNSSTRKPADCANILKQNKVSGVIVINVEGAGDASGFDTIVSATKEGKVLTTSEGAEGIFKAFSEVAKMISGDVVLEDF